MITPGADRNLLYGVLALQMGFIGRDELLSALTAWLSAEGKSLDQILVEQGALAPADHAPVEHVVRRHLERNHDDPTRSLAALGAGMPETVREVVALVHDPDLDSRLAELETRPQPGGPNGDATTAWAPDSVLGPEGRPSEVAAGGPCGPSRYRVVRPHARGGLGEVFVAWDAELGRNVALKAIRPEHAQDERLRARFVREAGVNGNLEHPGIVPVYGLGVHADGRPYYAMRLVAGETLQEALERFRAEADGADAAAWAVGVRPLLRRFHDICYAVDYAHSRGVLHRDLKPSNILLGTFGESLIIDWGLAKFLGRPDPGAPAAGGAPTAIPADDGSQVPTVDGETLGSPPYMSPEQARGEHDTLDRASDIYSLGATLYAVLTGRPPVVGRPDAIVARVARGEIDPPRVVNPRIPPALAAICLKTMRPDPADRYPTARALADDLDRWLADLPVSVYRDPPSTRLLRWSRRHKLAVSIALAGLLLAVVGLLVATSVVNEQRRLTAVERDNAASARDTAERSLAEANEARRLAHDHLKDGLLAVDQLVTLGDRQLVAQPGLGARRGSLEAAATFIRRFREREPDDVGVLIPAAQIARRLANLYRLGGQYDRAEPLYEEAVAILEGLDRPGPGQQTARDLLAETRLDRADTWLLRGRPDQAEADARAARELAAANVSASPRDGRYRRTLAHALARIAAARHRAGLGGVLERLDEAIPILTRLADAALPGVVGAIERHDSLPMSDQHELVQALADLGAERARLGRPADAIGPLREAYGRMDELARLLAGRDVPDVAAYHAWISTRLARALADVGNDGQAADLLDDAIGRLEALAGARPEVPEFQVALADARAARAGVRERRGDDSAARDDAEAALAILRPTADGLEPTPEALSLRAEAAGVLARLALLDGGAGKARARKFLAHAVADQEAALKAIPGDPEGRRRLEELRKQLADLGGGEN